MENSNNTGKIVAALLVGAAIGGALGILFTHEKGSELRKFIASKTNGLTQSLKEKLNTLLEEAGKEFESSKADGISRLDK